MRADPISRGIAFVFDAIPASLGVFASSLLPDGTALAGLFLLLYWLLRDITGASPGKRLFGLTVTGQTGAPATVRARILRNATLLLAPLGVVGSDLGLSFLTAVGGAAILLEEVMLIVAKRRIGDMLAGTTVAASRQREGSHPGAA